MQQTLRSVNDGSEQPEIFQGPSNEGPASDTDELFDQAQPGLSDTVAGGQHATPDIQTAGQGIPSDEADQAAHEPAPAEECEVRFCAGANIDV